MPELHPYDVIRRPVITEKSNIMQDELNQFVFEVNPNANKFQIMEAVELVFDIDADDILKVRTLVMPAKRGRRGRKAYIRRRQWKKAIVTLNDGISIEIFNV
ncbi:MAG: 50S ribosomal protein L23 [Phototrophicaceae bacterium]